MKAETIYTVVEIDVSADDHPNMVTMECKDEIITLGTYFCLNSTTLMCAGLPFELLRVGTKVRLTAEIV